MDYWTECFGADWEIVGPVLIHRTVGYTCRYVLGRLRYWEFVGPVGIVGLLRFGRPANFVVVVESTAAQDMNRPPDYTVVGQTDPYFGRAQGRPLYSCREYPDNRGSLDYY